MLCIIKKILVAYLEFKFIRRPGFLFAKFGNPSKREYSIT